MEYLDNAYDYASEAFESANELFSKYDPFPNFGLPMVKAAGSSCASNDDSFMRFKEGLVDALSNRDERCTHAEGGMIFICDEQLDQKLKKLINAKDEYEFGVSLGEYLRKMM